MATEFRILGQLEVVQAGVPRRLGSLRQRGLLARLLIQAGRPIPADRLIEELWPEEVPGTARHTLHVYISRLRAVLGDERHRLASDATGYRLQIEPDMLDAARFERLAAAGRSALDEDDPGRGADLLGEALALWRGPALLEFAEEPFAVAEATRLGQLRLAVLEDRIGAELELGLHSQLTEELRTLTLEQPYRETLWEQLMLALYRSGRQADALQAFGQARTRLADELGIEPGPALKRMQQRILAHDPALSPGPPATIHTVPREQTEPTQPPGNLPLQRTTFVGRERDLAIASELLGVSRLLTLTGAPGAGKTRMALRLVGDHRHRFPDGTFFVSLSGVSDPQQLEPAIAAAIAAAMADGSGDGGRRGERPGTSSGSLAEDLAGQHLLLLLDNLEQVAGAAEPISRLLDALPEMTILATSRAPLGVTGEQEFPVLPLAVPPADTPPDPARIGAYDAVALLVTRARAADPRFELTAANAVAIAGITARLDGLPLALELGAGRLRALTPQGLLDRLERRLPLLTTGTTDTIERHHTLREAIAWSYELLTADEQRLFRRLAPFVSPFTADAAARVAERSLEDTWSGIESLMAQSLVYRPVDVGEARFAMLQTLREFALEQLERNGELEGALAHHARYFLELAERSGTDPTAGRAEDAGANLSRELEEIRAAVRRSSQSGDRELGLRLAGATWRAWQAAGRIAEGRQLLTRLLDGPGIEARVRADALVALAGLDYWQADYAAAREAYLEALELYRAAADRGREADVLSGLSMTATWSGDPVEGARLAAEARSLFESLGDRAKVGETLMAQGFALWQQRDYAAARPMWEAALAISRELRADTLAVTQLAGLAGIEYHTGARADATSMALDALGQACDLENVALCVWLLGFVAAFAAEERPEKAVRVAGAADALRRSAGGGMQVEDLHVEPARVAAGRKLEHAAVERAWAEGRALGLSEAIDEARSLRPVSID